MPGRPTRSQLPGAPTTYLPKRSLDGQIDLVDRSVTDYLRTNVYVTTSGHFRAAALEMTIAEVGADRVLFSVDYPFEEMADATNWFNGVSLSDADRALIAAENARRVFRMR